MKELYSSQLGRKKASRAKLAEIFVNDVKKHVNRIPDDKMWSPAPKIPKTVKNIPSNIRGIFGSLRRVEFYRPLRAPTGL